MSKKARSLMIAIPMRAAVYADCFAAIQEAVCGAMDLWRKREGEDAAFILKHVMRAHIVGARNEIAEDVRDMDVDFVLWFDDDAVPGPDILGKLWKTLEDEKADAVVPWFQTRAGSNVNHYWDGEKAVLVDPLPARVHEIHATGMHTALMKGSVITRTMEALDSPLIFSPPTPKCGEDIYFWQHATIKAGCRLVCDSRIKVGHAGVTVGWPKEE